MNTQKAPLQFHPISNDPNSPIPYAIGNFAEKINSVYPRILALYESERDEEYQWSRYHLRLYPRFDKHTLESFPQWLSDHMTPPLIARPQHCDPDEISNCRERLIVEISPVVIPFYESHLIEHQEQIARRFCGIPFGSREITLSRMERIEVGSYHCRMAELIDEDMPANTALQFAYRITFMRYNEDDQWEARGHLIPYSHALQAVELLRSGPDAVLYLFSSLLAEHEKDRKQMFKDFELTTITDVAARIILGEHRTSFVGTFSDGKPVLTSPVYYYGCWDNCFNSFYLPDGDELSLGDHGQLKELLAHDGISIFDIGDSRLVGDLPRGAEGQAHLFHMNGWTYVTFWNKSYDSRNGNHSDFFTQGIWDFDTMCRIARQEYPMLWKKLDERGIKVVLVS